MGRGVVVAGLACTLAPRMPDKERNVRHLRPERVGWLAYDTVLPMGTTVVGEHDEQGILEEPQFAHLVEEVAEPAVHHRYLPGVERPHTLKLPVGEVATGTFVRPVRLPTVITLIVE